LWQLYYPQQNMVDEKQVEFRMDMQGASVVEGQVGQKLICRSGDQLRLVQLSNRFLAVNQLRPYMGWEEGFRDLILARWDEVRETLGVEQIARIGLRYINRIEIPQQPLEWEEWFNFCLPLPQSFRHPSGQFHLVFHQAMTDGMRSVINTCGPPIALSKICITRSYRVIAVVLLINCSYIVYRNTHSYVA
jgi:uncharacterized protein (TIGR04255 family)